MLYTLDFAINNPLPASSTWVTTTHLAVLKKSFGFADFLFVCCGLRQAWALRLSSTWVGVEGRLGNGVGFCRFCIMHVTIATAYGGYPGFTLLLMYYDGNGAWGETSAIGNGFSPPGRKAWRGFLIASRKTKSTCSPPAEQSYC